jgi:hypothetical protein
MDKDSIANIDIRSILQTGVNVITSPSVFFRGMPRTGGYLEPFLFMVVMGVITGVIKAVLSILGLHFSMSSGIALVILLPVVTSLYAFAGALLLYVVWKLMGSHESYETAFRCLAFIAALTPVTALLGILPYIGSLITVILYTSFLVITSAEVHHIPSRKAWIVFGIIGTILFFMHASNEFAARKAGSDSKRSKKEVAQVSIAMEKETRSPLTRSRAMP